MLELNGLQRKYLRGLAHGLRPVVLIGQKRLTETVLLSVRQSLAAHELIKVKFVELKEKDEKETLLEAVCRETGCSPVGVIGHTAILYLQQPDPEKRRIVLPKGEGGRKDRPRGLVGSP